MMKKCLCLLAAAFSLHATEAHFDIATTVTHSEGQDYKVEMTITKPGSDADTKELFAQHVVVCQEGTPVDVTLNDEQGYSVGIHYLVADGSMEADVTIRENDECIHQWSNTVVLN